MKWQRATTLLRLLFLCLGMAGLGLAWYLTRISSSGIEDVPPPFILLAGLTGLGFTGLTVSGRYPRREA
jgi:hypothetical protein